MRQENQAECIANEDGERQIACAIAFQGDETVRLRTFLVTT
jgi:heat shock 70kDa protein 1/2/6/8